jgi:hypothetical protein
VDQTVAITCSATDALSGVVSTTCQAVGGPAYDFPLGRNTFSATATDRADNAGSGRVSFSVSVTFDSLCNVAQRFCTSAGVGNSLCASLRAAKAAEARGNLAAKAGALGSFRNEVRAQSGKKLTPVQAGKLNALSLAL